MKFALLMAVTSVALWACITAPREGAGKQDDGLRARCCAECRDAFGKSPAAIGQEGAWCGRFMTAVPLSERCREHFRKLPTTVEECGWEESPGSRGMLPRRTRKAH